MQSRPLFFARHVEMHADVAKGCLDQSLHQNRLIGKVVIDKVARDAKAQCQSRKRYVALARLVHVVECLFKDLLPSVFRRESVARAVGGLRLEPTRGKAVVSHALRQKFVQSPAAAVLTQAILQPQCTAAAGSEGFSEVFYCTLIQ